MFWLGTSVQIVIAMFLAFFVYELYNKFMPFIDKQTSNVSRIGQLSVLVSFFFALMIRGELVDDDSFIAAGLIIMSITIFMVTVYYGKSILLRFF
jgi:uncharacterized membrane protein